MESSKNIHILPALQSSKLAYYQESNNMEMENECIPYEQALALKELGFNKPCFGFYNNGEATPYIRQDLSDELKLIYTGDFEAPLFQQAFKWFREKYGLSGLIDIGTQEYSFFVFNEKEDSREVSNINGSYKEAELECLKKLIEIVKKNNENTY